MEFVAALGVAAAEGLGVLVGRGEPESVEADGQLGELEAAAVVESVKAASEVYAPVGGEVVEVNGDLDGNPALVNEDAEGGAWFFKIKIADKSELSKLMSKADYDAFVAENG